MDIMIETETSTTFRLIITIGCGQTVKK